jgi:hypothetical protein
MGGSVDARARFFKYGKCSKVVYMYGILQSMVVSLWK